jgi:hypothetical protein
MFALFLALLFPIGLIVFVVCVTIEMWLKALLRLLEGRFTRAAIRISIGLLLLCWELSVPADPEAVFGVLVGAGFLADVGKIVWKHLPKTPEVPYRPLCWRLLKNVN